MAPSATFLSASMGNTFHLTTEERRMFDALPVAVTAPFRGKVEDETIDAYENQDQLKRRMRSASFTKDPRALLLAEKVLHKLLHGDDLGTVSITEMPEEILSSVLFSMGAIGVAGLIEVMLADCKDTETLQAIGMLSRARHTMLQANAATTA